MLTAITRGVSPKINDCELGFIARQPIDLSLAAAQHREYEQALRDLGIQVISLPAEPDLPDSIFVEDPAIVVDEIAVITRMGVASRRPETIALSRVLAQYRPLRWILEPATLEGGDVLRIGRTLFVGLSRRTNHEGIAQLAEILRPYGYHIKAVDVRGCLHLKSGACPIGGKIILANRDWVDTAAFEGCEIVSVPPDEPRAANVLAIGETVLMPSVFPRTMRIIEELGLKVRPLDLSELMKAEAGVTCSSILLDTK